METLYISDDTMCAIVSDYIAFVIETGDSMSLQEFIECLEDMNRDTQTDCDIYHPSEPYGYPCGDE